MIDPNNPTANATQTFDDNFQTSQTLSLTNPNGQNGVWNTDYSYNTPNDPNASNFLPSNAEQEWYVANTESKTDGYSPFSINSNGLTIQATQTPSSLLSSVKDQPYLSGELNTQGTFSQEYGLYEEKAQIPSGQGLWPAFWMVPENGQWPPELDVMESIGNSSQYYTTIHASSLANGYESAEAAVPNPSGYNTYAMDWEPDYTTFYINGKEVYQEKTPSDVDLPMYMETNLAVGGSWPGDPNSSTQFPADYNIADIQVYQSNANLAAGYTPQGSAAYYGTSGSGSGDSGSGGSTTTHDYLGDGHSQILIDNANNGSVFTGEVSNGALSYTQVASLGSEWKFVPGAADFLGQDHDQFLIENSNNGDLDVASVTNGQATYTHIGTLGSEWSIETVGNYTGGNMAQFLMYNQNNGSVDMGVVSSGTASYTQVASLGSEWKFVGSGDYLGQGHDQFLIENSNNGAVDVGSISNGQTTYSQVASLGSEWKFEATGDFLGDGKSQFLIENSNNGDVVVGEVGSNGQVTYTTVGALGSEWKITGAADLQGQGHDQFVMENSNNGDVDVGNVVNGQAQYTHVGSLGSEWSFHM